MHAARPCVGFSYAHVKCHAEGTDGPGAFVLRSPTPYPHEYGPDASPFTASVMGQFSDSFVMV